jgi:hypothetical protein
MKNVPPPPILDTKARKSEKIFCGTAPHGRPDSLLSRIRKGIFLQENRKDGNKTDERIIGI